MALLLLLLAFRSSTHYLSQAAALKSFVIWSMGSLGNVTGNQMQIKAFDNLYNLARFLNNDV